MDVETETKVIDGFGIEVKVEPTFLVVEVVEGRSGLVVVEEEEVVTEIVGE